MHFVEMTCVTWNTSPFILTISYQINTIIEYHIVIMKHTAWLWQMKCTCGSFYWNECYDNDKWIECCFNFNGNIQHEIIQTTSENSCKCIFQNSFCAVIDYVSMWCIMNNIISFQATIWRYNSIWQTKLEMRIYIVYSKQHVLITANT